VEFVKVFEPVEHRGRIRRVKQIFAVVGGRSRAFAARHIRDQRSVGRVFEDQHCRHVCDPSRAGIRIDPEGAATLSMPWIA